MGGASIRRFDFGSWPAAAVLVSAAVVVLYHRVLGMWWSADDPMVLWHANDFGPTDYFFDPAVWRSFNPAGLNPWMVLGFDVDLRLFGLHPAGFYLHQLLALAIACLAFWCCLRLFVSPQASLVGAMAVAVAPSTVELASNLATRHYIDGMTLSCLSCVYFVLSLRRSSRGFAVVAVACFVLALTTKEIFAPLPVVLVLLPEGAIRDRLKRLVPFAVVLIAYCGWRFWMLGSAVGGYRSRLAPSVDEIVESVRAAAVGWSALEIALLSGSVVVVFAGVFLLRRSPWPWRWFWIGFTICAVAPVIPVVHVYSPRHSFAIAVLGSAAVATVVDRIARTGFGKPLRWLISAAVLAPVCAGALAVDARLPSVDEARRVRVEGREVLRGTEADRVVVSPLMPYWHFFGLFQLRDQVLGLGAGPGVVSGICGLPPTDGFSPGESRRSVFDPESGGLVPMPVIPECVIDDEASLSVDIRFESGTTSWHLGPYTDGTYMVLWAISENSLIGIGVPPSGSQRGNIAFEMGMELMVEYQSPDGWRTHSPRLTGARRTDSIGIAWSR